MLALNWIAALIGIFFRNAWRYLYFGCLSSVVRSFTRIYERNSGYLGISTKRTWIMHELKTGLNADKCATFGMFPKSFFTHSFCKCPHTLYNRLNTSRLARFRKTWKHVNPGKTQCLFVDRFSLKNFSAAIDQCTIKSPKFVSTENIWSCLT